MGRAKKRNKDKNFAQKRRAKDNNWDENAPRHYKEIIKENAEFEKFYKMQQIVPENEWPAFMAKMQESLPTAFRITGSRAEAKALLEIVKGQFFKDCFNPTPTVGGDGQESPMEIDTKIQPICLPWYPDELAWQLQLTRKDIRSSEVYFRLHNFLISETSCGNISRQEVVSMIPPVVLGVQPHHKVLDMCAAPGSKTAQLIEALHADCNTMPSGFVIANDVDNNRCYMLVHQAKRLNSPCIIITNHDSAVMPNFDVINEDGTKGPLRFDRVLCDVPCSGDGTMRKNPDIWMKWNSANASNLHGIQARIVRRGLEMLAVGGRLVYSTCSINPLENEAVMHRILVETQGSVCLVDVSSQLPGLKYNPGMTHWLPASRDLVGYKSFEEVPEKWHTQIRPQMFPPKPEDLDKFNLNRCIRILPHHQDTGAFFVAVLEKVSTLPWEAQAKQAPGQPDAQAITAAAAAAAAGNGNGEAAVGVDQPEKPGEDSTPWGPQRKKRRVTGYKEDPFIFFEEEEPVWPAIRDFYDVCAALQPTCLLTRCKEGKKKNVYIVSPAVRDVVRLNQDRVKFINTGVKCFVRCDNKSAGLAGCAFRLAQEGLQSVLPFLGPKRKLVVTRDDLVKLLINDDPKTPPAVETLDPDTQVLAKKLTQGSCVLAYREQVPLDGSAREPLALQLVGWRGTMSVRAYIPVNDAVHCLRLCGADVSKFVKNKFRARAEGAAAPEGEEGGEEGEGDVIDEEVNDGDEDIEDAE